MSIIPITIIPLILVAGLIYAIYAAIKGIFGGKGTISNTGSMVCPACGSRGEAKTITKGSTGIELILWICFILPGLIYSVWRLSSRTKGCPTCGSSGMIPVNSPVGKRLIAGNSQSE